MIDHARSIISHASKITSFSGAGLSAESGIATFRDSQDGLWEEYDPMKMASPQGFAEDPSLVMQWYAWRRQRLAKATPNLAHRALAGRDDITHITQNVDDLLERAGATNVIHLHGTITQDHCHDRCGYAEAVDLATAPELRPCPKCGSSMRPSVVWFGESLPLDAWAAAESSCVATDVLLVIGTSAVVYPAAGLISWRSPPARKPSSSIPSGATPACLPTSN